LRIDRVDRVATTQEESWRGAGFDSGAESQAP
jgi:hypothetical protein